LDSVLYSSTGRPYFNETIDFSISHSANISVCAVSSGSKIGIDVELITDLDINDYRSVFTEKEWSEIINAVDPLVTFYRYWTMKECILKADGAGISEVASLEITNKQIRFKDNEWQVEEIFLEKNYVCHIAFPDRPASMNIRKIVF
jgi:4'-phosphopantetheinyl transferase